METNIATTSKRIGWSSTSSLVRLPWGPIAILTAMLFMTLFVPVLTAYDPMTPDLPRRLMPPAWTKGGSPAYLLGTDTLGRDIMTRILYGGRISLLVALFSCGVGGALGLAVGILAGYMRSVSSVAMRLVDGLLALPSLLIALVFAMTLGPSMKTVIVAKSMVLWARFARVIYGEALGISKRDYVLQARVAGCSGYRIMLVHILPNIFNTFMILLSLNVGWVITFEASLSFLGAGIPPPTPSWGQMVSEGKDYIVSAWWISFFPGATLALTVLGFQMLGDWLRDRLDPKLRQL